MPDEQVADVLREPPIGGRGQAHLAPSGRSRPATPARPTASSPPSPVGAPSSMACTSAAHCPSTDRVGGARGGDEHGAENSAPARRGVTEIEQRVNRVGKIVPSEEEPRGGRSAQSCGERARDRCWAARPAASRQFSASRSSRTDRRSTSGVHGSSADARVPRNVLQRAAVSALGFGRTARVPVHDERRRVYGLV